MGRYKSPWEAGFLPGECCLQADKCYFTAEEAGVGVSSSSSSTGPVGLLTDRSSTNTQTMWSKTQRAAVKSWFGCRRPLAGVVGMGQRALDEGAETALSGSRCAAV